MFQFEDRCCDVGKMAAVIAGLCGWQRLFLGRLIHALPPGTREWIIPRGRQGCKMERSAPRLAGIGDRNDRVYRRTTSRRTAPAFPGRVRRRPRIRGRCWGGARGGGICRWAGPTTGRVVRQARLRGFAGIDHFPLQHKRNEIDFIKVRGNVLLAAADAAAVATRHGARGRARRFNHRQRDANRAGGVLRHRIHVGVTSWQVRPRVHPEAS